MNNEYSFESHKNITEEQIGEIRELEILSNSCDETHYRLFLENTFNADRDIDFIFLSRYKGKLVSFLLLFFPDISEIEVYGYSHPDYRRKGLFKTLINSSRRALDKYSSCSYLYVCDLDSTDGKHFLTHINAELEEVEYQMELDWDLFDKYIHIQNRDDRSIKMEKGRIEQFEQISLISSTMYGEETDKSSEFVRQTILSENREQLIGLIDGRIAGICAVGREGDSVMINGLAIDRGYQGKGFGREFLDQIIFYVRDVYKCSLKLEVSSINDKAYNLYKSVGFIQNESYGYFREKH